jgi:hypothetical protein
VRARRRSARAAPRARVAAAGKRTRRRERGAALCGPERVHSAGALTTCAAPPLYAAVRRAASARTRRAALVRALVRQQARAVALAHAAAAAAHVAAGAECSARDAGILALAPSPQRQRF